MGSYRGLVARRLRQRNRKRKKHKIEMNEYVFECRPEPMNVAPVPVSSIYGLWRLQ